jgi:hypothetical protein
MHNKGMKVSHEMFSGFSLSPAMPWWKRKYLHEWNFYDNIQTSNAVMNHQFAAHNFQPNMTYD